VKSLTFPRPLVSPSVSSSTSLSLSSLFSSLLDSEFSLSSDFLFTFLSFIRHCSQADLDKLTNFLLPSSRPSPALTRLIRLFLSSSCSSSCLLLLEIFSHFCLFPRFVPSLFTLHPKVLALLEHAIQSSNSPESIQLTICSLKLIGFLSFETSPRTRPLRLQVMEKIRQRWKISQTNKLITNQQETKRDECDIQLLCVWIMGNIISNGMIKELEQGKQQGKEKENHEILQPWLIHLLDDCNESIDTVGLLAPYFSESFRCFSLIGRSFKSAPSQLIQSNHPTFSIDYFTLQLIEKIIAFAVERWQTNTFSSDIALSWLPFTRFLLVFLAPSHSSLTSLNSSLALSFSHFLSLSLELYLQYRFPSSLLIEFLTIFLQLPTVSPHLSLSSVLLSNALRLASASSPLQSLLLLYIAKFPIKNDELINPNPTVQIIPIVQRKEKTNESSMNPDEIDCIETAEMSLN
jgi:hypothetical protein